MTINTGTFSTLGLRIDGSIQAELLTAIARSAEELTNGRGWPQGVDDLLGDLGRITGVSRVWIFQILELTEDSILQDYAFEWAAAPEYVQIGLPQFNRFRTKIDQPGYRSMVASRKRGEYQKVITRKLSPSWLKSNQEEQKILSMLTIPITVENRWWGTLGFDDCDREYDWSDAEIALLRTAGFLISSAVLRDSLSAKRKQLDILQKITACSAWQFDLARWHLWCTSEVFSGTPGKTEHLQFSFRQIIKMIHQEDLKRFFNTMRRFDVNSGKKFRCDLRLMRECGDFRWIELTGSVDLEAGRHKAQVAGIAIDITPRKEAEDRLRHEAATDPLTGAVNRRKLEAAVSEQIDTYIRTSRVFTLMMLDLDHFKQINDTHGHAVGDRVLKHFVKICRQCLRHKDSLARVGGEEFAILLPGTTEAEAVSVGERIRSMLSQHPFSLKGGAIPYTVSMGCAMATDRFLDTGKIYAQADSALYQAKRSGRNRVVSAGTCTFCRCDRISSDPVQPDATSPLVTNLIDFSGG